MAWDQQRAESLNSEDLPRSGAPAPCPEWRDMEGQQALEVLFGSKGGVWSTSEAKQLVSRGRSGGDCSSSED